jgi:hypothetical protein
METTKNINIEVNGMEKLINVIENNKEMSFLTKQFIKELRDKKGGCVYIVPDNLIAEKYNIKKNGDLHLLLSAFKQTFL